MKKIINSKSGITLIELLLSISLISSTLLISTVFTNSLLEARVKSQVIAEVDQQGIAAMEFIMEDIAQQSGISSPAPGNRASSLSYSGGSYSLSSGAIQKSGGGPPADLTNSQVVVTEIFFSNYALADTSDSIQIEFTVRYANTDGRYEYTYEKTFYGTVNLKP